MNEPTKYSKICPKCGEMIYYKSYDSLRVSNKKRGCRLCVNKNIDGYSPEEIEILKKWYPVGGAEMCKLYLNSRSIASIHVKANHLNIRIFKPAPINEANKICCRCKTEMDKKLFGCDRHRLSKLKPICKICEKEYRIKTKNEKFMYDKKYTKMKYKTDINYRLRKLLRGRIHGALKLKNTKKLASTFELIGCSVSELKSHLESKFKDGMTWNNHSLFGWHIDHIKPCSSFDLTKEKQQKECFHYTNLQPLWAIDNLSKWANPQI